MSGINGIGAQATALARQGRFEDAERLLRAGLEQAPGHPVASYALGILLLARGAYEEGWRLYEYRVAMPRGPRPPDLSFPLWTGGPVRSLVILPEQGFGDQIMFARYAPELAARGIDVTLAAPPALARLFGRLGVRVLVIDGETVIPKHDAWCFAGSLPRLVGSIPSSTYLGSEQALAGSGVGFMTRCGQPDSHRSLPQELSAKLLDLGVDLHPEQTGCVDFEDTAKILESLALVVSVDTAVAHLAGAMGKQTFLMLPYQSDWRWGRNSTSTIWYPTVELVRQEQRGDWENVVERIVRMV